MLQVASSQQRTAKDNIILGTLTSTAVKCPNFVNKGLRYDFMILVFANAKHYMILLSIKQLKVKMIRIR